MNHVDIYTVVWVYILAEVVMGHIVLVSWKRRQRRTLDWLLVC